MRCHTRLHLGFSFWEYGKFQLAWWSHRVALFSGLDHPLPTEPQLNHQSISTCISECGTPSWACFFLFVFCVVLLVIVLRCVVFCCVVSLMSMMLIFICIKYKRLPDSHNTENGSICNWWCRFCCNFVPRVPVTLPSPWSWSHWKTKVEAGVSLWGRSLFYWRWVVVSNM